MANPRTFPQSDREQIRSIKLKQKDSNGTLNPMEVEPGVLTQIQVNGVPAKALLDTGSTIN